MAERTVPRRWLERAFVALVGAGLIYSGWGVWHDRRLADRFTGVNLGMDRSAVEARLGKPRWAGGCAGRIRYLPREECSSELGYASAFAPLRPLYYVVQLDRRGRAIEAEPIRSR